LYAGISGPKWWIWTLWMHCISIRLYTVWSQYSPIVCQYLQTVLNHKIITFWLSDVNQFNLIQPGESIWIEILSPAGLYYQSVTVLDWLHVVKFPNDTTILFQFLQFFFLQHSEFLCRFAFTGIELSWSCGLWPVLQLLGWMSDVWWWWGCSHHRHKTDKYLDTRRPITTAADHVAIGHFQKSSLQDGRLPELLLAYSCLTNHSKAALLWLVTPKQDVGDHQWLVICCNVEYLNFGMLNLRPSNVKVIF